MYTHTCIYIWWLYMLIYIHMICIYIHIWYVYIIEPYLLPLMYHDEINLPSHFDSKDAIIADAIGGGNLWWVKTTIVRWWKWCQIWTFLFFFLGGKHAGLVILYPSMHTKQTVPGAMGGPDGQLRKRLGLREDEEVPLDPFTALWRSWDFERYRIGWIVVTSYYTPKAPKGNDSPPWP